MRSGFVGFWPLLLIPLLIIYLHFLSFFRFMSLPASCPVISLLSFSCAHIGPGLSTYARIYLKPRLQVAYNEVGLIVCSWSLGSPSSQPRTLLSCRVPF